MRLRQVCILLTTLLLVATGCSDDPDPDGNNDNPDAISGDTDIDAEPDAGDSGDAAPDGDTGPPPEEVVSCDNTLEAAPAGNSCSVTSGSSSLVMLQGQVLAGDTIYENGQVLIDRSQENATIACTGCDCGDEPDAASATVISCSDSVISPGLVNAHEHLGWASAEPRSHGDERYDHRNDWRRGLRGHDSISSGSGVYSSGNVLFGELRHMLSGATVIAGSSSGDGSKGFLRNMDNSSATGGLDVSVKYSTFPLGDVSGALVSSGCSYPGFDNDSVLANDVYLPHISEGIDAEARNEYLCLSSMNNGGSDLVENNTSVIHGIGLTAIDIADFAANGSELVWSPRTNIDLYGNTADAITYDNYGVTIALGTDWLVSGSMNMLRELSCVDYLNQNHYNNHFSDRQLWKMATENGAISMGVGDQIGKIEQGYVADISIFDASDRSNYRAVLGGEVSDVQLVMRGGQPLVGEPNLVEALVDAGELGGCEALDLCGNDRLICAQRDTGQSLSDILGAAVDDYEAFYCDTPPNEPTCVPSRPDEYDGMSVADDQDGDGVVDAEDTCPTVFNPARPVDGDSQHDYDGDGIGDACDVCPITDGEQCDPFDPTDRDDDGITNDEDNCPAIANPAQDDADTDDIGDACDRCPDFANAGGSGCPATTYDIWSGEASLGEKVLLSDVTVTSVNGTDAIHVQYAADSDDFAGVEQSGIYAFIRGFTPFPERGDRIDISATVGEYGGSFQLTNAESITVLDTGTTLPAPVMLDPADVATGGSLVEDYLGVLIRVENVTVTDANPDAPDDYNEFAVTGDLRVDDMLYEVTPAPEVGDFFNALVGPLHYSFGNSKLVPRDQNDIIFGPPELIDMSPSAVFLEAGQTAVPTPALQVELNRPPASDTLVALDYGNTAVVDGPAEVTILANETTADVQLSAAAGAAGQTSTVEATLDGATFTTDVTVYDDATLREIASLDPTTQSVQINQSGIFTVTLTVPAPTGGSSVDLTATGGLAALATVTVPEGALSADFTVDAGDTAGAEQVTATLGASSATSDVTITDAPLIPCMVISEYVEGSSFNKGIEIHNCGPVDLEMSDFGVCQANNDGPDCDYTLTLPAGTIAPGGVHTICHTSADFTCDTTSGSVANHNGDDRFIVFEDTDGSGVYESANDTITDAWGQTAIRPASTIWSDQTYRRCDFTPYDGQQAFSVDDYYTTHPKDEFSDFGTAPASNVTCN